MGAAELGSRTATVTDGAAGRLDRALTELGLTPTRSRAADLIRSGAVLVDGTPESRPGAKVRPGALLTAPETHWVGRGALKLLEALDRFGIRPVGRRALDVGASTGGFTQVLLDHGASHVVALDVGHDQLDPRLRTDPRVTNLEGTNIRHTDLTTIGGAVDLVVIDVSFIGLGHVLPVVATLVTPGADAIALVKPQFEVGRGGLDGTGVVRSASARLDAARAVLDTAAEQGFHTLGAVRSPVAGGSGNIEYLVHLRRATSDTMAMEDARVDLLQLEPDLGGVR